MFWVLQYDKNNLEVSAEPGFNIQSQVMKLSLLKYVLCQNKSDLKVLFVIKFHH